ncbi:MAG: hypothetical protein HUK08_05030 [Bacteroidaceae bacterium]|nr:hypothetical protein [Bacteroidaceae bacterium]
MQNINPNDFKIKPLQVVLYFIVMGALMVLCLMNGFSLIGASLMSLGTMVLLILTEYLIVGWLEKRRDERENADVDDQ